MHAPVPPRAGTPLSGQELRVLQMIADGLATEDISQRLGVTLNTVNAHVRNLCRKLGTKTRSHAVAIGLRTGLIE